jgi:hypothetical protein
LGALKTTATDILEAHANIPPFHLILEQVRHRALLRMATLPDSNPIHHHIQRVNRVRVKRHPSPIHRLLNAYRHIRPDKLEKVKAVRYRPGWAPFFNVDIQDSKEEAKQAVEGDQWTLLVVFIQDTVSVTVGRYTYTSNCSKIRLTPRQY